MRNLFLRLCLFACLLLAFSCKKKADIVKPVYPVSAYVGNYQWIPGTVTCTLAIDTAHGDRIVDITASGDNKTITIEFLDDAAGGNNINVAGHWFPDAYFLYAVSNGSSYSTTSGTVSITANNGPSQKLSAQFDFVAHDNSISDPNSGRIHISSGALNNVSYNIIYR